MSLFGVCFDVSKVCVFKNYVCAFFCVFSLPKSKSNRKFLSSPKFGISRFFFGGGRGVFKNIHQNYFVGKLFYPYVACDRLRKKKGVGGYMKEVDWSPREKKLVKYSVLQRMVPLI